MYRIYNHKRLAALAREHEVSAGEISRRLGIVAQRKIHRATVARHLKGQAQPLAWTLGAYADLFRVSVDAFFDTFGV